MKRYSVKEVADLSGVSVRTLHHYDAIGLLKPIAVATNGYRQYGRSELLRLQQILFHRALGYPLKDIVRALDDPDFDAAAALAAHRQRLRQDRQRAGALIKTIDQTLDHLAAGNALDDADLYAGFSPEQQSDYEQWLIDRYGGVMKNRITASTKAFKQLSEQDRESVMTELAEVEQGLAEGLRRGEPSESETHDLLLDRHRAWIAFMWDRPCDFAAYSGLADLYLSHPDFKTRYETIESGFTTYLTDAMKAYCERAAA